MVAHFPCPVVDYEGLVAVGEGVCDPDSVEAAVGSTGHCMLLPGSIGLAVAVDVPDLARAVLGIHSCLDNRRVVAHSPMLLDRNGHCPIAHCLLGHNRNHSSSGRTAGHGNHRSPDAVAASVVVLPGRSVAVVGARSCCTAVGVPLRRCEWGGVVGDNGGTALSSREARKQAGSDVRRAGSVALKCACAGALSRAGPGSACVAYVGYWWTWGMGW